MTDRAFAEKVCEIVRKALEAENIYLYLELVPDVQRSDWEGQWMLQVRDYPARKR